MTLGELMDSLGGRVSALLMLVCALPFCAPVSIPGLSTPFGIVIAVLAARYAVGLPPWLPRRLRAVSLPPRIVGRVLEGGGRVVEWFERRLRPRWLWVVDAPWKLRVHALASLFAALLLMLPLPPFPPFTNTLPALTVVLLTMSSLERDGVAILFGHALLLGTVGYFAFWGAVVWEALRRFFPALMGS